MSQENQETTRLAVVLLNESECQAIMDGLGEMKAKVSAPVMASLQQQFANQGSVINTILEQSIANSEQKEDKKEPEFVPGEQ
ncbi:hypothetical protein VPHK369_0042 [Vibrio phage K369]